MSDASIYRFGSFELDLLRRELRTGGERVPLQPRMFMLLHHFAANPARAISRDELLADVWSGVVVADGSLTKAVRGLRTTLRRDPSLRNAIETVRGHGYRFSAAVETLAPEAQRAGRMPRGAPLLVGREAELAQIEALANGVRQGGRGFLLLVGDPGTGKTALARHGLAISAAGFRIGEGQCIEGFGEQSPYLPVLEALVNYSRADGDRSRARVREIIERAAPSWKAHLPVLFPESVSDAREPGSAVLPMDRQALDALEMIGSQWPAVLFVEDIHWADQSTLVLLNAIARRSAPSRLLTICTTRKAELNANSLLGRLHSEVSRSAEGLVLETKPVAIDAVSQYAIWRLEREVTADDESTNAFVDWLYARTGGHPLFMTQLLDHLASLGLLNTASPGGFSTKRLDEAGIPATLGQLIREWMKQLDPVDRGFLEAASAAGFQFDLRLPQAALGVDDEVAESSADRLCQAGWLRFRDFGTWAEGGRGARFRFEHVLFREALYDGIPPTRRARLHGAIALRLEAANPGDPTLASELAAHFELAGALAEATRKHVESASFAASIQSADEALHHAELAMRRLDVLPKAERTAAEIDLQLAVGIAWAARSGFGDDRAMEAYARAQRLANETGDVAREVAAIWGIASCNKMRGALPSTRMDGERLLALAEATNEHRYLLLALDLLCSVAFFQGRFEDCIALKHRTDVVPLGDPGDALLARSLEDVRVTAQLYGAIAQWHRGEEAVTDAWIRDAVARAESFGHPYTTATVAAFASISSSLFGDREAQRRHAVRGRVVCEKNGIALWGEIARFMEIHAEPPSDETLAGLRAALREMSRYGGLGGTLFIEMLAERELAAGRFEAAGRLCRSGIELALRTSERNHLPMLYATAARLEANPTQRKRLFERAADCARELGSVALESRVETARSAFSDGRG